MAARIDRRQLLSGGLALGAFSAIGAGPARAALGPNEKYDLVVKGGEVLDPSQNLRARRDIGIRYGLIEAIEAEIPKERADKTIDATGKLVTPGLVDLHAHVYPYGSAIGIPADELVPFTCATTMISAGDAGANNFAAFRRHIVAQTRTRMYAFVHIANFGLSGFPVGEMLNIDHADVEAAAKTIAQNADIVLGCKVRMTKNVVGQNGAEPLRRAIQACERSGVRGAKVMMHIGDAPGSISELLDMLRPGDILTHAYSGAGNNIVQDGRLLPAAKAAKERGVVFDVGHGGGSFDYTIAEAAIPQGAPPTTISSDIHVFSGNTPGMPFLPIVMAKFLNMGFSLEDVVRMATVEPAKVIAREPKLGTLQVGAPADVAIMELVEQPVSFVDTRNNTRQGSRFLKPVQTVRAGVPFGRPFMSPFSPT
jgi:dihydroorotase